MTAPRLSRRTQWSIESTPLHRAIEAARTAGRDLVDLTITDPSASGLSYPDEVYRGLGTAQSRRYAPTPLGLRSAREAVSAYYARRGHAIDPDRVWLCASTSEAYAQVLTLLCDAGDSIAVPVPGYPLLDHLSDAVGVRRTPYRVELDGRWCIDEGSLWDATADPTVRAIVAVTPNNPTGAIVSESERALIEARCRSQGLGLVIDEVFADYPVEPQPAPRWLPASVGAFVLSGLSKVAALPQMKLSWVVLSGPDRFIDAVRPRIEILADAFLSVSTPVQLALPRFLDAADAMQHRIRDRCAQNIAALDDAIARNAVDRAPIEAGWSALLRLPALPGHDDERWALELLAHGVVASPGYLFDLDGPPRVVLSLLTPPPLWREGISRVLTGVEAVCRA